MVARNPIKGGVAGGAGGAAAPPGFWMGSKKILSKLSRFGRFWANWTTPGNVRLKCDHTISGGLFCAKGVV